MHEIISGEAPNGYAIMLARCIKVAIPCQPSQAPRIRLDTAFDLSGKVRRGKALE